MKRLIFIACLLLSSGAHSVQLSAIYGGYSYHLDNQKYPHKYVYKPDVKYNNDHQVKAFEASHKRFSVTASSFINSYYQKSLGLSLHYKVKGLYIGVSVANGYKTHLNNSSEISYGPSIRYDFKYLSIYTIGSAVVTSLKIPIL